MTTPPRGVNLSPRSARLQSADGETPYIAVTPDAAIERVTSKWRTYDNATAALDAHNAGKLITPPDAANGPPVLSEDMLQSSNMSIGTNMVRIMAWYQHLSEIKARLEAQLLEVDNTMRTLEALFRRDYKAMHPKATLTEIDDVIALEPTYMNFAVVKQNLKQQILLLSPKVDYFHNGYRILSRNIELIKMEREQIRGESNAGNRHKYT
jgi:hypothetical protein